MNGAYTITNISDAKGTARIISDAWVAVFSQKPDKIIKSAIQAVRRGEIPAQIHLTDERIRKAKSGEGFDYVKISEIKHLNAYRLPDGHRRVQYHFERKYDYHILCCGQDLHGQLDKIQYEARRMLRGEIPRGQPINPVS